MRRIGDGDDADPVNPAIGEKPRTTPLRVYNAYAIYTNSGASVYLRADCRSTNASVTVTAAEYFDTTTMPAGSGTALIAVDGSFNSTNEPVHLTFTPSFTNGQRRVLWIHAKGSNNQWSRFEKVIVNPNINDILAKVKANYSQISNISMSISTKEYLENTLESTETVTFRQNGPYKLRWDNQTTGAITIINDNQIDLIDENGELTPLTVIANGDPSASVSKQTDFFWDVDRFIEKHTLGSAITTNQSGGYCFVATPNFGSGMPYTSVNCVVDFRYGVVTSVQFAEEGSAVTRISQGTAIEVQSGIWFHTERDWRFEPDTNWQLRRKEEFQISTIQINTSSVSNELFHVQ